MASVITLASAAINGVPDPLVQSLRANAPWTGASVPTNIAAITQTAGTASLLTLTPGTIAQYPILNLTKLAGAIGPNQISIPDASTCAGLKFRIVNMAVVAITEQIVLQAAGQLRGFSVMNAVPAAIAAATVSVTSSATCAAGDYVEFASNGAVWHTTAFSSVAAGWAVA